MKNIPCAFSPKEKKYLLNSKECWLNILKGGMRAGKNVVNSFAFCLALETSPSYVNLIAGVDQAAARINIMECDGFGVLNYFHGRIRPGKFEGKDAYYVQAKVGERVIIVAGGRKVSDAAYIKGYTIAVAYITESNECHPDFIEMVLTRTWSFGNRRRVFMDLNPKAPNHWFNEKVIDRHLDEQRKDSTYGFNFDTVTMADNMSLSNETIRSILKTIQRGSIEWDRNVLGLDKVAEGLCFTPFAKHIEDFLIDKDKFDKNSIVNIAVGVDWGGNGSQHTFVCRGYTSNYREVIFLASEIVIAKGLTPDELYKKYVEFVQKMNTEYCLHLNPNGTRIRLKISTFADSAEQTLINGLRVASKRAYLNNEIYNAAKRPINDRIRLINLLCGQHRVKLIKQDTKSLQDAWSTAVWDSKEAELGNDVRLDNGTSDIDTCDAAEYTIERDLEKLQAMG
jgi:PBSX family phage terminase large subunit